MRSIQSCADMMFVYRSALALFVFFTTQHWPAGRQPRTFISFSIIFSFFSLFLVWIIFAFQILQVIWHLPFIFRSVLYQFYPSENIHNFTLLVFPRVEKEKNPNEKIVAALRLGFCYCPENFNWMPFEKKKSKSNEKTQNSCSSSSSSTLWLVFCYCRVLQAKDHQKSSV